MRSGIGNGEQTSGSTFYIIWRKKFSFFSLYLVKQHTHTHSVSQHSVGCHQHHWAENVKLIVPEKQNKIILNFNEKK